ncbi:hypothetical protein TraAM80_10513 [Trypanosoma rangeli]|uniref:Leishmanolysin-like peptidase n=1 Tax=Trypanosoma rangeli TaxID=5698 RepID=A0A422MNV2_TRYRA|nr:uncharacterized protein TraAM80_10513 [Trypanosoma rangeli]RNE94894.1 hypothetical protein TraAM80_10513 [Trypanosoma rangeli]|eukprot:RNE94894.1 hypothetical protein TraAM80_10513 [Trypanosoma rangeli]
MPRLVTDAFHHTESSTSCWSLHAAIIYLFIVRKARQTRVTAMRPSLLATVPLLLLLLLCCTTGRLTAARHRCMFNEIMARSDSRPAKMVLELPPKGPEYLASVHRLHRSGGDGEVGTHPHRGVQAGPG